jgi:hypothetical protein
MDGVIYSWAGNGLEYWTPVWFGWVGVGTRADAPAQAAAAVHTFPHLHYFYHLFWEAGIHISGVFDTEL